MYNLKNSYPIEKVQTLRMLAHSKSVILIVVWSVQKVGVLFNHIYDVHCVIHISSLDSERHTGHIIYTMANAYQVYLDQYADWLPCVNGRVTRYNSQEFLG